MIKELFDPRLQFWRWFAKNEPRYFVLDPSRRDELERLFQDLAGRLAKVHPDLTFEFGPISTPRQLVISAGGIRTAFGAVTTLVAAAPHLEKWKIIAFRPRHELCAVQIEGVRVDPDKVHFALLDDGKKAGVYLFIPGYVESQIIYKQIGYLLLDTALGEFDVETKVGLIKMFAPEAHVHEDRYPLSKLPELFDQLMAQLGGSDPLA